MISPEEFMNSEICQKTLGRQQLETFELVGAFYNVLEPESRYDFIRSILDERGALLARYHNLICNDLAPKLRKKQIRYRPDQYSVEFIPAAEACAPFDCNLIVITMPLPERPLLCARIFLLYNDDLTQQGYYTVERALPSQEAESSYTIGTWLPDETHCGTELAFDDLANEDYHSSPDFLVAPDTSPDLAVNKLPDRVKAELRAVYLYFSGTIDPLVGMDPRLMKIVEEWEKERPGVELTADELERVVKERYGDDWNGEPEN